MNFSEGKVKEKQKRLERKKSFRVIAEGFFAAAFIFAALIFIFRVLDNFTGYLGELPETDFSRLYQDGTPSVIYDNNGSEVQKLFASYNDSTYVQIEDIPDSVKNAFIAFYDPNFYIHSELNLEGMLDDIYIGLAGMSDVSSDDSEGYISEADNSVRTITQRLINNQLLYEGLGLSASERVRNNFIAQRWAMRLQKDADKNEVLEKYLNTLYFGYNTVGVSDAAERYFNKSIRDLDVPEAAVLVALSINYKENDPYSENENCRVMVKRVLNCMLDEEMISEKEYEDYLGDDVYSETKRDHTEKAVIRQDTVDDYDQALVDSLIKDLVEYEKFTQTQAYNAVFRGGLRIFSCRDRKLSEAAMKIAGDDKYYPDKIRYKLDYVYTCTDNEGDTIEFTQDDLMKHLADMKHRRKVRKPYFSSEDKAKKKIAEYEGYLNKHGFSRTDEGRGRSVNLSKQPQAAFVLINQKKGYVEAMSGGRGENSYDMKNGTDRATGILRQPGNALSIFSVYLPAIDSYHMTLADIVDASSRGLSSFEKKYTEKSEYTGLINMRNAVKSSNNTAAIKFFKEISPTASYDYMKNAGITTLMDNTEADLQSGSTSDRMKNSKAAVGVMQNGISPLELTAAYAAVANEGKYIKPVFYTKVERRNGENIISSKKKGTAIVRRCSAWLVENVLQDCMNDKDGKNRYLKHENMASAGLEGKSADGADSWFMGFTSYRTLGVWMGNDDEDKKTDCGEHAVKMWTGIMDSIIDIKNEKTAQFKLDNLITAKDICSKSGKLGIHGICDSDDVNSEIYTEYFVKGTEPDDSCDRHVRFLVDKDTGFPADKTTPEKNILKKVLLIKDTGGINDETDDKKYMASESFLDSLKGDSDG